MSKAGIRFAYLLDDNGRFPLLDEKGRSAKSSFGCSARSCTPPASGCAFSPAYFSHGKWPRARHGFQNIYAEGPRSTSCSTTCLSLHFQICYASLWLPWGY
eukprot:1446713-Amphidinium_carterae.1